VHVPPSSNAVLIVSVTQQEKPESSRSIQQWTI